MKEVVDKGVVGSIGQGLNQNIPLCCGSIPQKPALQVAIRLDRGQLQQGDPEVVAWLVIIYLICVGSS